MALFSVRNEPQFCERLGYDVLFKWILEMNVLDADFNHLVFSRNKERLLRGDVSRGLFREIVGLARECGLSSGEHFSMDGTLLHGWESMKSFRTKGKHGSVPGGCGRNRAVDFQGKRWENEIHESRTDPSTRLARKGAGKVECRCYGGQISMENRQRLVVAVKITEAT